MHFLFCQLPNNNFFTQHVIYLYGETPLVNYRPRSILYILLSTASAVYFLQALFIYLLQTNIIFHTICLILYFQQTGEIDNPTASWGKVFWLCCVQFHIAVGAEVTPRQAPSTNILVPLPKVS
jgi:hypothetical protein